MPVVAWIVMGVACAPPPATGDGTSARPTRIPRRSHVLITSEEIAASTARDAYEAVQVLRPDWLHGRGATSFSGGVPELQVYLDGQRIGTRQILSQFAVAAIREIRFHSASDATQRWGTGHSGGVIEIISRMK